MRLSFLLSCIAWIPTFLPLAAAEPQWIWSHGTAATQAEQGDCYFRRTFEVDKVETAALEISADNRYELFVNGRLLGSGQVWQERTRYDLRAVLKPGRNVVAVKVGNDGVDPAGLCVRLDVKSAWREPLVLSTSDAWKTSTQAASGWQGEKFDDAKWSSAVPLGEYGKTAPWGAAGKLVMHEANQEVHPRNQETGQFALRDGDRLVLLGSTFIERMQHNGYFELELQCALPDRKVAVRNLGWSGDTVWGDSRAVFGQRADGFRRLLNDVKLCNPGVILVCYGENEAHAGEPGLIEFRAGLETLLENLEGTGARIVVASPPRRPKQHGRLPDPAAYNASLLQYANVLREVATERNHTFVDWFNLTCDDPACYEGIHLSGYGYNLLAPRIAATLGAARPGWELDYDQQSTSYSATGLTVQQLATTPGSFQITATNRFLPGLPLTTESHDVRQYRVTGYLPGSTPSIRVRNLASGRYELHGNGQPLASSVSDVQLAAGIQPAPIHADQLATLLMTIRRKDFLFFNRYRPQNETYLFLFRKHEQGNNAVEIPRFDALVDELDQQIATLKKPVPVMLELKRLGDREP